MTCFEVILCTSRGRELGGLKVVPIERRLKVTSDVIFSFCLCAAVSNENLNLLQTDGHDSHNNCQMYFKSKRKQHTVALCEMQHA